MKFLCLINRSKRFYKKRVENSGLVISGGDRIEYVRKISGICQYVKSGTLNTSKL